jgi:hypothetical protein
MEGYLAGCICHFYNFLKACACVLTFGFIGLEYKMIISIEISVYTLLQLSFIFVLYVKMH